MLDIFKARLKAKSTAAGVNLSKERITALADRLHRKFPDLNEEADHDKEVDTLDDLISFADIAKEDDRVRTLEKRLEPKPEPKPADPKPADQQKPDEMPAWFKPFADKIAKQEEEKQTQTEAERLAKHDLLKDIPAKFYLKRVLPKTDEEREAFAAEVAADFAEIVPVQTEQPFIPGTGKRQKSDTKPSDKQLDDIVNNIMK